MRYVRFRDPEGAVRDGEWVGGAGAQIVAYPETGEPYALDRREFASTEVTVLPPCDPTKVVCVGLNYADHAAEQGKELPDRPMLFLKPPSAVAGHGDELALPAGKERVDHEAELGVVMGRRCRDVDAADAMEYVAGFTCVNDVSNRDDQVVEQNWVRGKAFDDAAPIGPVVATPEEVPGDAAVECAVNGEVVQSSGRDQFIFSVPELIAEITTYITLESGDVISTGTPAGVGPLSDGDTVEVTVGGVGTLRNTIRVP